MSAAVDCSVTSTESPLNSLSPSFQSFGTSPVCQGNGLTEKLPDVDSGVALNFSEDFRQRLSDGGKHTTSNGVNSYSSGIRQASGINLNLRSNRVGRGTLPPACLGTPPIDLRRSSIDCMMNTGGLLINQDNKCELHLDKMNANDLEQLYSEANLHRPSYSASTDQEGMVSVTEDLTSSEKHSMAVYSQNRHSSLTSKDIKNWWSPKFNSKVLEKQLSKTVIEFLLTRFRVALIFIALFALVWMIVFSVQNKFVPPSSGDEVERSNLNLAVYSVQYTLEYVIGEGVLLLFIGALLFVTYTRLYAKYALHLSVILALILFSFSLTVALSKARQGFPSMSFVAQFAITAVVILVVFTLSRLPIWFSVVLSVLYLLILECLVGCFTFLLNSESVSLRTYIGSTISRLLLYTCLILSGATTAYLSKVRQVVTFWKIAQCVLSEKVFDLERELEEKIILTTMPKYFTNVLLNVQVQLMFMLKQRAVQESGGNLNPVYQSITTPFNICSMDNVTILFADIVNFTSFSSALPAAELVDILNTVFSIFDDLVPINNCEKISTLGDCYFCVSGCPDPEEKHADNCVNMGLAILKALEDYRAKSTLPVEMRVGIHTGSVFCGVMGSKRFKFDVWSRDVRIANQIESLSTPGKVLISDSTRSQLSDSYMIKHANLQITEPEHVDMRLFFVTGQTNVTLPSGTSVNSHIRGEEENDTIDCKSDDKENQVEQLQCRTDSINSKFSFHPLWKRKVATLPSRTLARGHSSSSLVDIKTHLERFTSYAHLAVPQAEEDNNIDMDEEIVKYMEEHKVHFDTYFQPQLQAITLNFYNSDWESTYRNCGRDLNDGLNSELTEMELGYRITKFSYMLDTVTQFISFLLIMTSNAICLSSDDTFKNVWHAWLGIFLFGFAVEGTILFFVVAVFYPRIFPVRLAKFAAKIFNWYIRSLVGLFFMYYPMTVACISMTYCQPYKDQSTELSGLAHVHLTFYITIVVLLSTITFMEISYVVKFVGSVLSGILAIVMVVVLRLNLCVRHISESLSLVTTDTTEVRPITQTEMPKRDFPTTAPDSYITNYYERHIAPQAIVLILLVLMVLTVVNRLSEKYVRFSFIARVAASARRRLTRRLQYQSEWLLHNIIPPNVAHKLRTAGKYSQNHECVGVMFASIVNFQKFVQDGGNEEVKSLQLLHAIISEFDMLLEQQQFASIEKIKTTGSIYMAASGLGLTSDEPAGDNELNATSHLLELINFAEQLMEILKIMNQRISDFAFEMHVGINYGPVTSGVVGSRKMLFDIWGDTVNVASRMASTGTVNHIHIPQRCLEKLGKYVNHTVHKVINVKGKGKMNTVFITLPLKTNI